MKVLIAEVGKYMETLKKYAGTDVAVLPGEFNWSNVVESVDPFAAILQCSSLRHQVDLLE